MYASILTYADFRYLKWAAMLTFVSLALYIWHAPTQPPNGGTWLGYGLGTVGAGLIGFLAWFGVRKRQYHRTDGKLAGWASAHVYLGAALIVVVSLHCGFQFGWNVHTLAYGLTVVVVVSGFYGLYTYLVFPERMTRNRADRSRQLLIAQIAGLDEEGLELADRLGEPFHHSMLLAIEATRFGGSLWRQVTGGAFGDWGGSRGLRQGSKMHSGHAAALGGAFVGRTVQQIHRDTEADLTRFVTEARSPEQIRQAASLLDLLHQREGLVRCLQRDDRYHALMKCWLCIHIPFSIALLSALVVHVVVVFFYW